MTFVQEYPLASPLSTITNHTHLPCNAVEIGRIVDTSSAHNKLFVFVKRGTHLSILITYHHLRTNEYYCDQFDFPLRVLSWFPKALEEFRKPPAEGGLHAGGMISKDVNVDGEMLAVGRTTDGYCLTNWSRQSPLFSNYAPAEISLRSEFIYELGLLNLWRSLGEKFDRGEL